jgi:hypothetical protein
MTQGIQYTSSSYGIVPAGRATRTSAPASPRDSRVRSAWRTVRRFLTEPRPLPNSLVDDVLSDSPSSARIRSDLIRLDVQLHGRFY